MDMSIISVGAGATDAALTINRVVLGTFFSISGYHKLFNATRHATLVRTLQHDDVVALPAMQWLVPAVEFTAGCGLVIGLVSALAASSLLVICAGAVALDARKRVRAWRPVDAADWLSDVLYLPEVLYCVGLSIVMLAGRGRWSLDALLASL
jgi:uncharacterized membrane protein YphA (DoxX/SURF4 family)